MPDCSAVRITAYLPDRLIHQGEAILAELSDVENDGGWDWKVNTTTGDEATIDNAVLQWEDYDCPWGTNTPDEAGVFTRLRELGIPYEATDYGHYTWDGETQVYSLDGLVTPGSAWMAKPRYIPSGVEGTRYIPAHWITQLARASERTGFHGVTQAEAFQAAVLARIPPDLG